MKKLLTLVALALLALGAISPAAGAGLTRHYPVGRVHSQAKPLCVGKRRAQHSAFRFHPAGPPGLLSRQAGFALCSSDLTLWKSGDKAGHRLVSTICFASHDRSPNDG
jgi:hypothetical protein